MNSIGQFFLALLVGWCCYMAAAMAMGIGSFGVQTLLGLFITGLTLMPVFLVGLPLRWIEPVNRFWRRNWWLAAVLSVAAVALMGAAWLPENRSPYEDPSVPGRVLESPHPWLGMAGWTLAMFAAAHFYPPMRRDRAEPHP